jgi:glycosyltransferase involved in cell wall biosynthesis
MIYHHRTRGEGVEATHIRGISESFERRGWKVEIVSPPGVKVEGLTGVQRGERHRSIFWTVLSDYSPQIFFELLELSYNLYSLYRIPRILQVTGAGLIYERYSLFNWAGTWVARRRGIPIVLEINDATVIVRSRRLVLRLVSEVIEGWIFRNSTHLITVSEYFKNSICKRHRIPPDRICVMPNAVDPCRFPGSAAARNENFGTSIVVGMVAAFVHWHGLEFLIRSVGPFLKSTHSKLLLVGDGPERTVIEKWIGQMDVARWVELAGSVPASDVPMFLERMDICVMADSNEHGSPMKIFEYMAAGKPVVAPSYGPIREIITHKVDGWLFEPMESASLLEAIDALANSPDLRRQLGIAARQTVLLKHTWDHRVREVERWVAPVPA